jgi:two-component system sensor histidine kinase KdpD
MSQMVEGSRSWLVYLRTVAAVALTVAAVAAIRRWVELPTAVLLYLVPVTLAATRWGRGPSVLAAVLSVTLHNLLFVEPVGTLSVDHPADAFSLVLLLFTALVTAQLADSARRGARAERDAAVARRSDELKTALLRTVSHELRTPLASIKASVSGMRQTDASYTPEDRAELLESIEDETDRLDRLVENLLDASRLETGALTPRLAPNDLQGLVNAVMTKMRDRLRGRTVRLDIPDDLPPVACEYALVEQVVRNLIENAILHTGPDVAVSIDVHQQNGMVRTAICDDGPGIPKNDRERLLRPFERGATQAHGSGLGLAIARGFIEAHHGRLWIEAGPNGGGTRLVFTLPVWSSSS